MQRDATAAPPGGDQPERYDRALLTGTPRGPTGRTPRRSLLPTAPTAVLTWLGWPDGEDVLLVGATSTVEAMSVHESLLEVNNELATVERQLAKQNATPERVNDDKGRLLGTVAHDLRNPLAAVIGLAER